MTQPASNFTVVNDRVVFDNGITKRWRCPVSGMRMVARVASKVLFGLRNSSGR